MSSPISARRICDGRQMEQFRPVASDIAARDSRDLMSWPFFSLAKSRRVVPIDFHMGAVSIRVEATPEHGMATIWDADILIWAASQIVEARNHGLRTSRLMAATPYEILTFIRRDDSARSYLRLKAALDRLQSTTVATSIRQPAERRRHRFSWINEWKELLDQRRRPLGIELILPDWFYAGVMDDALVLTIDRAYFDLKGGLERWLYRLVRRHGGRQPGGWSFDLRHLHLKSGSLSPFKRFAFEIRAIVQRQPLPGYRLSLGIGSDGLPRLCFQPPPPIPSPPRLALRVGERSACEQAVDRAVLSGTIRPVLSGTRHPCYREPWRDVTALNPNRNSAPPNLPNLRNPNLVGARQAVENTDLSLNSWTGSAMNGGDE